MLWEILKASKGILVADFYADLWANIAGGGTPVDIFVEMVGSLPLYYNGKGYDLTDYLISGNAIQDGTPSADAPVDATGSGVRTGNIIDPADMMDGYFVNPSGVIEGSSRRTTTPIIAVNGTYMTLTYSTRLDNVYALYALFSSGTMISRLTGIMSGAMINISQADSICVSFYSANSQVYVHSAELQIQLAYGSTALPYEPYGFKLPLTVNGTEYPIYLGQVESTRRVKKLVLTGEENWQIYTSASNTYRLSISNNQSVGNPALCSHFVNSSISAIASGKFTVGSTWIYIRYADVADLAAFKSYLAAQYAAGTPVTVWYVLAKPETGIVNEPLMKIGDYADTVSAAQAGVTIPTVSGANVLDMASPVKPSEMYIKGKGIKPMEGGN